MSKVLSKIQFVLDIISYRLTTGTVTYAIYFRLGPILAMFRGFSVVILKNIKKKK